MTDKELLELAAKAAGIKSRPGLIHVNGALWVEHGVIGVKEWSPLTDDGDAHRLAVNLMMSGDISKHEDSTYAYAGEVTRVYAWEMWRDDKYAATRRAIVRAAAAIGETLP